MEVWTLYFDLLHTAGAGELIVIPDALSRDFVRGSVLCDRCLEVVAEIEFDVLQETECGPDEGPDGEFWKSGNLCTAAERLFGERAGADMSSSSKPHKSSCA
jgi:hypothetical protein